MKNGRQAGKAEIGKLKEENRGEGEAAEVLKG
jgi:hypothetical protein